MSIQQATGLTNRLPQQQAAAEPEALFQPYRELCGILGDEAIRRRGLPALG